LFYSFRIYIQRHIEKKHADVSDGMRYLVDLENEWPEYYELEAAWKEKMTNESEHSSTTTTTAEE
jgi:hypothetical protein